jgi:hypothetical protein
MSVPVLAPNSQLNIQGVHASNISASPILSSYPTSTTSTSLGHYHFVDSNNASNHLNVSNNKVGGHIFSHASATQTPKEILKIDRDGMLTDTKYITKTSTPNVILDSTLDKSVLTNRNDLFKSIVNSEVIRFYYNDIINMVLNNSSENPNINFTSPNIESNVSSSEFKITGQECIVKQVNSGFYIDDVDKTYRFLAVSNQVELSSELTSNKIVLTNNPLTPSIKVKDNTINDSELSSTDLTFNGVSIFTSLADNAKKHIVPQMIVSSPAIYADSSIAPQPSPFLTAYGFGGWAYKKQSPQASNAKINWYLPFPINNGTVGDIKGLYYQIFNNCLGTGDLPFFVVYTRPTGNDYAPWYHSSRTYVPASNSPANQTCQMYANIKGLTFTPNSIGIQNQINMTQSTTNGTYLDTDVILAVAFGTNSGSALNAVDFSCSKIGIITDSFSGEYNLL